MSAQDAPTVAPAAIEPASVTTTASTASRDPVRTQTTSDLSPETRPELGTDTTDGTTAAASAAPAARGITDVTKAEKIGNGEVLIEAHPVNDGILSYKGPGLKGLIFSKKYFWFSDEPLEQNQLSGYLNNEKSKDIAHPNAAHASQTGKGLLFFAKRAEDKNHPQGIFNLADVTDVVKGSFNDFGFSLHGQKHQFQASTKSEKDGWLVAIETKAMESRTTRESIVGSSGYKSELEKYGAHAAGAITDPSRSLSRPKKASKSRERKTPGTTASTTSDLAADTTVGTTDESTSNTIGEKKTAENTAGGTAAGVPGGIATTRNGSISAEDKALAQKSRSRSRNNKRSSIFGGLLGKKDEKQELKEEGKEVKQLEKQAKHAGVAGTADFDAAAIASRVVGEPVIPAPEASTHVKETTPAAGAETSATETTPISTTRENAPKPNKRASIFGGLFGKKDVANPNLTENAPTVPAKDEPSTVASVAPHLDKPVTSPTAETSADVKETSGTAADATHPTTTTTPTDKRRSPFFGNFGTKKERRTGGTSDAELTDGEVKKQPSGGFGGLLRKASRAQKSPSGTTSKEADVLLPKETSNAAEPAVNGKTVTDNPAKVEGDAGNNAMTESHEQTPVSAAA